MAFVLFALATIGLTNILVHGRILDVIKIGSMSVREWLNTISFIQEVLECYECTGFWAGLLVGTFFWWPHWWLFPLYAFAGSVLAQTYTDVMYLLRSKVEFELPEENNAEESAEG